MLDRAFTLQLQLSYVPKSTPIDWYKNMKYHLLAASLAASLLAVIAIPSATQYPTGLAGSTYYVDAEAYSTFTLTVDNALDSESLVETRTIIVDAKTREPVSVKVYRPGIFN